jgi:hypothetical protein
MLELLLMHVAIFSTLGQPWLASIQSSRRGRLETATGDSLLPQAAPLLLPRSKRWEALATATPLLLPRARRMLHLMLHCGDVGGASSSQTPRGGFIQRLLFGLQ